MTDEEFKLNKNQVVILEFLERAKSSQERPVNLNSAFGFRTHRDEDQSENRQYSDERMTKLYQGSAKSKFYSDYLEIAASNRKYVDHLQEFGWITKSGKEALAKFKAEEKKKKVSK